jgi:hypothetical protein
MMRSVYQARSVYLELDAESFLCTSEVANRPWMYKTSDKRTYCRIQPVMGLSGISFDLHSAEHAPSRNSAMSRLDWAGAKSVIRVWW